MPGIDSKFIEQYRAVLATLLDQVLPENQIDRDKTGVNDLFA